ncbi:U3 small nucleolar RNA-associated protein 25 [Rhynchospora pubera]|uniref:U3 small nucleolar RNA-associated protein 25 n=1 Tax=Rhynchospora pubera TaxID=906938 RepID=A0AAV8HFI9_9POAL|nr:U3 small nucleolar RNA-associated protein 25 [Rhynchospora pubera]
MGKPRTISKNKGSKRPKISHKPGPSPAEKLSKKGKAERTNHVENGRLGEVSPTSSSGCSFEEDLDSGPVEHGYSGGDSSVLNLLDVLGSSNPKLAAMYKKRQREQLGLSSSDDEEEDGRSASGSMSDKEYTDEEGSGNESGPSNLDENYAKEIMDDGDEESAEDYPEDCSDEDDIETSSSFDSHLARSLMKEEVDNLKDPKWKYKWEMPENNIILSKWTGTGEPISKEPGKEMDASLKEKIHKNWKNINKASASSATNSSRENFFFSLFNTYRDIMHCNKKPFYVKGGEEDSIIMDAYLLHILNHIYRTRELVIKNDTKLNKLQGGTKEVLGSDAYLDQGFTRPKVLFLLPLRSIALRVVLRLIQLTPLTNKDNVEHLDRFTEEFGGINDEEHNKKDLSSQGRSKPADFRTLFGGNNNDHFVLGIKFTKRTMKLYSDFYSSDIIVASPLGLVTKIGETEFDKEKDVDYLSSIEIVVIDHADVIVMQNWTHVNTVFDHLNLTPSKQHGTDIMRIRPWYLDGQARFYRQTILLGSYLNPDINALFNRFCVNYEGKAKLVSEYKGVLPKILLQVQQIYERFNPSSIIDADDARLDYFCKKVFPKIKDSIEGGIMIFISSYFEFVRIRNFLKSQNASFCLLGEYTKQSDISRARVWFFEGKRKIMLYTERAHFYHRYKIRGIQNLIIYSLPERKEFYPEVINMLDASRNMMCNVLFSCFDLLKLERIVGTAAAKRMLSSDKDMFVFS